LVDPDTTADRDLARAELRESEKTLEKLKNGPRSQEKDAARAALEASQAKLRLLRAGSREQQIEQARKELETAEASGRLAKEEYDRADILYQKSANAKAEFDTASANLRTAEGRLGAARARLADLLAGSRPQEIEEGEADV